MDELHLTKGQKHDGYYFYSPQTDFFFVTDFAKHPRKNLWIVKLIDDILKKNDCTWRGHFDTLQLKDMLQRATIELQSNGHGDYYNIRGDGFGCGDYVWNRQTKIYQL
jgi:hypothetical protein